LSREENRGAKDKELYACTLDELNRRLHRVEKDYESAKEDKLKMQKMLNELEHSQNELADAKANAEKQSALAISTLQRQHDHQVKTLTAKYEQLSEQYNKACKELAEALGRQHLMGDRWKEEAKSNAEQYERLLKEAVGKYQNAKVALAEVQNENQRLSTMKDHLLNQISEEKQVGFMKRE
jgi:chromosome segregation ATPase